MVMASRFPAPLGVFSCLENLQRPASQQPLSQDPTEPGDPEKFVIFVFLGVDVLDLLRSQCSSVVFGEL